jgi:hypothetical protein
MNERLFKGTGDFIPGIQERCSSGAAGRRRWVRLWFMAAVGTLARPVCQIHAHAVNRQSFLSSGFWSAHSLRWFLECLYVLLMSAQLRKRCLMDRHCR